MNEYVSDILDRYNDFNTIKILSHIISITNYDVTSNIMKMSIQSQIEYHSNNVLDYKNKRVYAIDLFYIILGLTHDGVKFVINDDDKVSKRMIKSFAKDLDKIKDKIDSSIGGPSVWELDYSRTFEGRFFTLKLNTNSMKEPCSIKSLLLDKFE